MASQPPQPPESIIWAAFTGIKNTVSRERLQVGELELGVNIDIDDAGQVRRRRGYALKDAANYHSARTIGARTFVVKDGTLGLLNPDYTHTAIAAVGPDHLAYTNIGETIYYASRSTSGKIVDGAARAWGQVGGAGQWVSPVMRPTATLGAISGRLLKAPPFAEELEAYKGRIYLGSGPVMWCTELYLYDLVDMTKGYIQFEHDITMIRAVEKGLFVGTTQQLFFLEGTYSTGLKRSIVLDAPVIRGSAAQAPAADVSPQGKGADAPEGTAWVFMTAEGICAGFDDGQVYNLTRGRVVFPGAVRAAALYRQDQGANAYVAVADSAGGPSSGIGIGDWADAQIVRASQRGL